ncbi:MAG: hypothetical protein ACRC80_31260 [Waterburya sp.]
MSIEKNSQSFASKANALIPLALIASAAVIFSLAMMKNLYDSQVVRDTLQTLTTGAIALARGGKDGD